LNGFNSRVIRLSHFLTSLSCYQPTLEYIKAFHALAKAWHGFTKRLPKVLKELFKVAKPRINLAPPF